MKVGRIEHLGIAIKDIDKGVSFYKDLLGLDVEPIMREESVGVAMAFVNIGESSLELMSPLEDPPARSVGDIMRKFIESRGEGVHHLAIAVDDIEAALKELDAKGVALLDKVPRPGAHGKIAFVNPKSSNGVLIELCEPPSHG